MSKDRLTFPIGSGVTTILMIIIVLTLATFATLTLASARADYRLSQINADTVSAYYAADAAAAELYADFLHSGENELETTIPMTDTQNLVIRLARTAEGGVQILRWQTAPTDDGSGRGDDPLPVWRNE